MTRPGIYLLSAAVALSALGAVGYSLSKKPPERGPAQAAAIGGPFELTDHTGRQVSERDFRGKPTLIFFGFTYCPEVCPTTLHEITAWLGALGPEADKLNVAFVSVDPERDTPEQMQAYLSTFDPRIRGLTGTPAAVAEVARAYRVYYRKVPVEGGSYTVDHSSMVYMMDADGAFIAPIAYGEPQALVVPKLRALAQGR